MARPGAGRAGPVINDPTVEQIPEGLEALVRLVIEQMVRACVVSVSPHQIQPSPTPDAPILITVPEAAKLLSIKRSQAYDLAARGVIPTIKLGPRSTRVIRQDLEKCVWGLLNTTPGTQRGITQIEAAPQARHKAGRPS